MTLSENPGVDCDRLLEAMRASGTPLTRQGYIDLAWGASVPSPWTAEHEWLLPLELRDWTKCGPDEQPGD